MLPEIKYENTMLRKIKFLSLIIMGLLFCSLRLFAQTGNGSISGRITDANTGEPLEGIKVKAEIWHPFYSQEAETGADGRYTIGNLVAGLYTVFTINDQFHIDEYYNNTIDSDLATKIKVNTGQHVDDINFDLGSGGKIRGKVTVIYTQNPVEGVGIHIINRYTHTVHSRVTTGEDGWYVSNALPAGDYIVKCVASNRGYVSVFYNKTRFRNDASTVSVEPMESRHGINFQLEHGADITGHVYSEDGIPIENAWVVVLQPQDSVWASQAYTDANGYYKAMGLASDNYVVQVLDADSWMYRNEYYQGKSNFGDATPVSVNYPIEKSGIDFYLKKVITDSIANSAISAVVSDKYPGSSLTLANVGGLSNTSEDDGAALLFGYPRSDMSFTTLQIDGRNIRFGSEDGNNLQPPVKSADEKVISRQWQFEQVRMIQNIKLVKSEWSLNKNEDTIELEYFVINEDPVNEYYIGLRILLDTMMGQDDGAPIQVPYYRDYNSANEMLFIAPHIPPWWTAIGKDEDSGEIIFAAQGTVKGYGATAPDRMAIANWQEWDVDPWQYDVNPDKLINDSAIYLWWEPQLIAAGDTLHAKTFYGLGEDTPDYEPPYLVSFSPKDESQENPVSAAIRIQIEDRQSAIDTTSIHAFVNNQPVHRHIISEDMKRVIVELVPNFDFKCNQTINVRLDPVRDLAEEANEMPTPVEFSFSIVEDAEPPQVIGHSPEDRQINVSSSASISVQLRDNLAGIDPDSLQLLVNDAQVSFTRQGDNLNTTLLYQPQQSWKSDSKISVKVQASDLADPANRMAPYEFSFFTYEPDTEAPYVENFFPANGSQNIVPNTPVSVNVCDLTPGVDASTIKLGVNGKPVGIQVTGTPDNYKVTYTPEKPFRYNEIVQLALDAADLEVESNKMQTAEWQFSIQRDDTPPVVSDFSPAPSDSNQSIHVPIHFRLKDALAGIDPQSILLKVDEKIVEVEIDSSNYRDVEVLFDHNEPFKTLATVNVTISAQDRAVPPNKMDDFSYWFTTMHEIDREPPLVSQQNPAPGDTITDFNSAISFHLIDRGSGVDAASIQLLVNGASADFSLSGAQYDYLVEHTPEKSFTFNEICDVAIEARDLADTVNIMETVHYRFYTPVDKKAPIVLRTIPENGGIGVLRQPQIQIFLRDEVAGVDTSSVQLKINDILVTPNFDSTLNNLIVSYQPEQPFEKGETVDISLIAKDLSYPPNQMDEPYRFNFQIIGDNVEDTMSPYTTIHIPERNSEDLPITQKISIQIHDDLSGVDKSSIRMLVNSALVHPKITGNLNNMLVTLDSVWQYNDSIHVEIRAQDLATTPNVMMPDQYFLKFKVDDKPPKIFDRSPVADVTEVYRNTAIQFTLEDNLSGIDSTSIQLFINNEEKQGFKIEGDSTAYNVTYQPPEPFGLNERVEVGVIAADMARPANRMEMDVWHFTTQSVLDTLPPYTLGHKPGRYESNVHLDAGFSVQIVDRGVGVNKDSIRVLMNNVEIEPEISGTPNQIQVKYQPPVRFIYNDTVWIKIYAMDLVENPNVMPVDEYYFTTQRDTDPPFVVDLIPADGTEFVSPNSIISFCIQDYGAGVDKNSIALNLQGHAVQPVITGDSSRYCVTYRPENPFAKGETVSLMINVRDLSHPANQMQPFQYSFKIQDELPDLELKEFYAIPDKNIKMNDPVQLVLKVQNGPTAINHPFSITISEDELKINNQDTVIQKLSADTLITIIKTARFEKGTHYLKAIVDSHEEIQESNEVNNLKEVKILVEAGRFHVRPNPFTPNGDGFNDDARFIFSQLELNNPELKLYNITQKNIKTLRYQSNNEFVWDGRDELGSLLPPGIYLYLLEDNNRIVAKGYVVLAR